MPGRSLLTDCRNAGISVALHYAVLPLRLENDELIVGSEDGIDLGFAGGPDA